MTKQTPVPAPASASAARPALRPAAVPKLRYRTARAVFALIVREMITTYGRSPGGYFWAVAQPIALITVLSLAFSLLLRSPPLGIDFTMFYATGLLPLRMFQMLSNNVGGALAYSKPLMAYPRVTFVDAIVGRAVLTILTQFVVSVVILSAITIWTQSSDTRSYEIVVAAYGMAIMLGVGIGTLNCFLFMLLPVWKLVWGIATGPMILLSAVLYLYEDLPLVAQNILWYNPMTHVTGLTRVGFYSTYNPAYINLPFVVACSLIPAFFGVMMLRKYGRSILYL